LRANFREMGRHPPMAVGIRKVKVPGLSHDVVWMILFNHLSRTPDLCQTDRQTHDDGKYRASIAMNE